MRAQLINPFLAATQEVFRTMLDCELVRGTPAPKRCHSPELEVSGMIGLSGKCQGMVVVSLGRATAIQATEIMSGQHPNGVDKDVVDAVGEITNMIAGAAKAKLEEYQLDMGLPTVVCGKHHIISFPTCSTPIVLPFESRLGPICIDVGLSEVKQPSESRLQNA